MTLIKNVKKINKYGCVFVLISALMVSPLVVAVPPAPTLNQARSGPSETSQASPSSHQVSEVVGYRVQRVDVSQQDLLLPDHVLPTSKTESHEARQMSTVLLPTGVEKLPADVKEFLHLSYLHHHSASVPMKTQTKPLAITLQKEELASKISQKFSISRHQAKEIVNVSFQEGRKHNLDPVLVLSVIAAESSFNPNVRNSSSGAMGLMQAIPKWHHDKMARLGIGYGDLLGISSNIQLGAVILKEYLRLSNGNMTMALQKYNGSAKDPRRRYSNKVFSHYRWLSSSNL